MGIDSRLLKSLKIPSLIILTEGMKVWIPVLHSSLPEYTHCIVNDRNITTPVAVFLVPDRGMKPSMASGFRTCLQSTWRAGTTTRRHSRLYPQVRD